jgi:hypothetical protein
MRTGAYHYLLVSPIESAMNNNAEYFVIPGKQCLLGRYTPESCPLFLTRDGFEKLQENDGEILDCFRLHTDSILKCVSPIGPFPR